jgi:LacI family transcriptional regulator
MAGDPYSILVSRIRSGYYPVGSRLTPERVLAEELGVHRTTIRRVISRMVADGLLESRRGCRPIIRLPGDTRSIALLMSGTASTRPFNEIITGVEKAASAAGYRLLFSNTYGVTGDLSRAAEAASLQDLIDHPVAGVVLWAFSPEDTLPYIEQLSARGCPVVTIDRRVPGAPADFVGIDNSDAVAQIVDYLAGLGHERMVFISGIYETTTTAREREQGFLSALESHGLPSGPERIVRVPDDPPSQWLAPMLSAPDRPTAFVALNDWFAFLIKRSVESIGYSVPDDVCLTGFDDLEDELLSTPFLTTIRQPFERMGRHAVRLLQRRQQDPSTPYVTLLLETQFIARSSTIPVSQMRTLEPVP